MGGAERVVEPVGDPSGTECWTKEDRVVSSASDRVEVKALRHLNIPTTHPSARKLRKLLGAPNVGFWSDWCVRKSTWRTFGRRLREQQPAFEAEGAANLQRVVSETHLVNIPLGVFLAVRGWKFHPNGANLLDLPTISCLERWM